MENIGRWVNENINSQIKTVTRAIYFLFEINISLTFIAVALKR